MSSSVFVAAGILASRILGLVRQRVFAHYFGVESDAADAWSAGFRIPNFLQNLFGEGALSASFIPVYASLLAKGDSEEADRVAGAVGSLLALVVSALVLVGVAATPVLIAVIAPGFEGDKRQLTIHVVRIVFPGIGLLVMSAWCLGVLNSHRRFLLSYSAPVLYNVAIIATLLAFGPQSFALEQLVIYLSLGSVVGSALQCFVQLPEVLRVAPRLRFQLTFADPNVKIVVANFLPVLVSRGVVQLSGYVDVVLATWLPTGAPTALSNAQILYLLPIGLFGMSVSAAELPAMASEAAVLTHDAVRERLNNGLRQIAFFVVPSAVAFLALGDVVAAAVFQTGRFTHDDSVLVWGVLAGSAVGLLATTMGRLYSSTFYALRDTRTPLRFAVARVALTTVLGYLAAITLPPALGLDPLWGTAGLTASAGLAGWVEMLMLRASLNSRIGATGLPASYVVRLWGAALTGAAVAWAIKLIVKPSDPILGGVVILVPYGLAYFAMSFLLRLPEASAVLARIKGR